MPTQKLEEIKNHYARNADSFAGELSKTGLETVSLPLQAPYLFSQQWLENRDLKGKRVLDLGCGNGVDSIFLARQGARVYGLDISFYQIQKGIERASISQNQNQIRFLVGNGEQLNYKDNSFDLVFARQALFCLDLEKAFSEISRVLKPDGKALIISNLAHNPFMWILRRFRYLLGTKQSWQVHRILKKKDFKFGSRYFEQTEIHYFDFFTLFLQALGIKDKRIVNLTFKFDRLLLSAPGIRKWAYKVVCIYSKSIK